MMNLEDKIKNSFKELEFKELGHSYSHKGKKLISVSSLIKNYCEPFDADKIAYFVSKKRGISKEAVLREWDNKKNKAITKGNSAHIFGEYYYTHGIAPQTVYDEGIIKFWDNIPNHIKPVLFELKMYSEEYELAGTADIILLNEKTNKLIIADYKTNNDLFKNYRNKKLLEPFGFLLDSPYNKYQLQLSFYQVLLEDAGYEVEKRKIIWLKPNGDYEFFNTKDYTQLIRKELKKIKLNNW